MRNILIRFSLCCLFLTITVMPSAAVVSCHCFQDRSFNPERPQASDQYFLTTMQNSLIAAAFNISKRDIVKFKMAGVDADLLWVCYYLADRSGLNIDDLLAAWVTGSDWLSLISGIVKSPKGLDEPFLGSMKTPDNLKQLASGAFQSVMSAQVGIASATLVSLERSGVGRKEQTMAIFIALLLGEDPLLINKSVVAGKQTWSQLLASTGLDPGQIESSWQKLLKLHEMGL